MWYAAPMLSAQWSLAGILPLAGIAVLLSIQACEGGGCLYDSECGAQQVCQASECVQVECSADYDCPAGVCAGDNTCVECRSAVDCYFGQFCANNTCVNDDGGDPTAGDPTQGQEPGDCGELAALQWSGAQPCMLLNPYEFFIVGELQTMWRGGPDIICSYDGSVQISSACGPLATNGAFQCPLDDSIAWDVDFMNSQAAMHGDFAPVTIAAHEWGHRNQAFLGLGPVNKSLELHADCQAGMFAAVAEHRGLLDMGDVYEAFSSLCMAGDAMGSPWFTPGAHGTCTERVSAFEAGYLGALDSLDLVCGSRPLDVMRDICG